MADAWLVHPVLNRNFPAWRPAVLADVLCGFTQSFQTNVGMEPQIMPRPLTFISFQIHYSLIILLSNATQHDHWQRRKIKN